jgi:aspartate racemase
MKRLGIIGGMSWESTALYYRILNEEVRTRLGGLHSADLILRSVDFQKIEHWQAAGEWDKAGDYLAQAAVELKSAGAEGLVIATNTMHKVADAVVEASGLELLHIADMTGEVIVKQGIKTVGLMATAFTMEQSFYKDRLTNKFGINVIIPTESQRSDVHRIIYEELCLGNISPESQARYVEIAEDLNKRGSETIILGCTEIGMLLTEAVTDVPLIDTTMVHAEQAVTWMLGS